VLVRTISEMSRGPLHRRTACLERLGYRQTPLRTSHSILMRWTGRPLYHAAPPRSGKVPLLARPRNRFHTRPSGDFDASKRDCTVRSDVAEALRWSKGRREAIGV
jgi:hypothetical protein